MKKIVKKMYIGLVYNKIKPGICDKLPGRLKGHDKGNTNPVFNEVYVAVEGYNEHILNLERFVKGLLNPYFENPRGKSSEYIDPKYDFVDTEYVQKIVEDRIKSHPLKVRRLKKQFLPITRYTARDIEEGINNFPEKYLEEI